MTAPIGFADGAARMRRIRQLTVAMFEETGQTAVVERGLDAALELFDADGASFWAAGEQTFECQLARGQGSAMLTGTSLPGTTLFAPDPSGLVVAVPVRIGGATVGAIRATRSAGTGRPEYAATDGEALSELADSLGAALHAAIRRGSAEPGRGLELVLEMSREIGSSLDLDRVLRTVVNLAAKAVEFDRGAVALSEAGRCDIRAVAGADTVDSKAPELQDLAVRAAWAVGVGQGFYLSDRTEPGSDAERIFAQIFGEDLEASRVASALYLPLKDEEGAVGILVFEAERPDFASEAERELLTILANQTTVAIRNAQLYARVPMADTLSALSARRRQLLALPRRRRMLALAIVAAALAALTLIQWPLRVPAVAPAFLPTDRVEVRAVVPGVVEQVMVREGMVVDRGVPVAQLRDAEARAEREALAAEIAAAERAAALAASRADPADERLERLRADALRRELALRDEALSLLTMRAPVRGVVLSRRPEERLGARLDAGETLVLLGRTDSLELEFGVDERDVGRVRPGAEVRLRVEALPQRTFVGTVSVLGHVTGVGSDHSTFPVRAVVPNPDGLLRPGMTAQARVLTEPMSALGRLLRTPVRTLRLFWWRMWSWT